jgi:hypothetical protein
MRNQCLVPTRIFLLLVLSLWLLNSGNVATAAPYTDSAHGNADPPPGSWLQEL